MPKTEAKKMTAILRVYLRDGGSTLSGTVDVPDLTNLPATVRSNEDLAEWIALKYWEKIDPDVNVNGPRTVVIGTKTEGVGSALVLLRREAIGCSVSINRKIT